jgi:mRNA interferase RelE/StbE
VESYKVFVKPSVYKDIDKVPKKDRKKIIERIWGLSEDPRPHGAIKLSGEEKYRFRQGNYRILYEICDGKLVVTVVKVRHRKDVYKK